MIPGIPGEALIIEVTLPERETDKIIKVSVRDDSDAELHSATLSHVSTGRYRDITYTVASSVDNDTDVLSAYFTVEDTPGVPSVIYGDWSESIQILETTMDLADVLNLKSTGYIIVGQGLGSTKYSENLTGVADRILVNYIVKIYDYTGQVANFDELLAMDITDGAGLFEVWLDAGDYIIRVEKEGVALLTKEITVT